MLNTDAGQTVAAEPRIVADGANASFEDGVLVGLQPILDGLNEQVALVDSDGIILAVNDKWRRQVERQARYGLHISRDYDEFIAALVADGDKGAVAILEGFRSVRAGSRHHFSITYKGVASFAGYVFNVVMTALTVGDRRFVLVSVYDVTQLVELKRERRRLGSQLLRAQEAERRRLARDLHDSAGQSLVALQLQLMNIPQHQLGPEAEASIIECKAAISNIQREIRALSFLLHPPFLESAGLEEALRDLVSGFGRRVGLEVSVETSHVGKASEAVEAAIYRVAQEAIVNIHRHAVATQAKVTLLGRRRHLHLVVEDNGHGLALERDRRVRLVGVGVSGMTERVRELGGRLWLGRVAQGTKLRVAIPRGDLKPED